MSGVKFTPEQQLAIGTTDRSVLVSAAAGSGKTAVLVERIINIILSGEANVDEMLVVTFTNAAASEMRLKLSKAIRKHIRQHPETASRLRGQLDRLYRAYISTFNSFAMRVIKEFFYEVDIEPGMQVCDDIKGTLLMRESVDELFELAFDRDDLIDGGSFTEFLRLYSSDRNETAIKDDLISTYNKLRSIPDYYNWARSKTEVLSLNKDAFLESVPGTRLLDFLKSTICDAYKCEAEMRKLFEATDLEGFYIKRTEKVQSFSEEYALIAELYNRCGEDVTLAELMDDMNNVHFDRMPAVTKEYKDAYGEIKDQVKDLRDKAKGSLNDWKSTFLLADLATSIEEMNSTYKYTNYYINLIEAFEEIYAGKKREIGVMDFSDMEHYASKILSNEEAASVLRKRFKFIFIDEYQDTNNLQEYLIGRFARPDNVFKVGDIKQSIYKFRQAEPAIFERTRKDYSGNCNDDATVIDLQRNFRTNSNTIDYINCVFRDIMDGYDETAELRAGLVFSDEGKAFDFTPEVHLLADEYSSQAAELDSADDEGETDDIADREIELLTKDEAEAKYVSEIIRDLIGTDFYDSKEGVVRKVTGGDIAILLRSVKRRGDTFARALRDIRVDSYVEEEADYFDAIEIRTALSLLQTIDNMRRDVPLIATLHSEIFGFTASELAIIKSDYRDHCNEAELEIDSHYSAAVEWYAEEGSDTSIREKLEAALSAIRRYRDMSVILPLENFIWEVLVDSEYYLFAGAIAGGARRQANLRLLVDRAGRFARENIATLGGFIEYLEIMQTKKISPGQSGEAAAADDSVRISTIHKSKGLEYPFVFVCGMGNKRNTDRTSKGCMLDSELGIALPYVRDDKKYWRTTLLQKIMSDKSKEDAFKEEIRVLYVAMTRARNKLYLIGSVKDYSILDEKLPGRSTFFSMMTNVLSTPYNRTVKAILPREDSFTSRTGTEGILKSKSKLDAGKVASEGQEIRRRLEYLYPDEELLKAPAKMSVSTIRKELLEEEAEVPSSAAEEEMYNIWKECEYRKTKANRADIGTAYHRIMEFIDFERVRKPDGSIDSEYINESITKLLELDVFEDDVYRNLKPKFIEAFFSSDLGRRASEAASRGELYKEKPFTLRMNHKGHDILVQGVIDCCFVENGKAVIVDYKSSFVHPGRNLDEEAERIRREYHTQVEIYSKAASEGLGLPVSESYLYLFTVNLAIAM